MKTNIITNNTIMKNEVNRTFMVKKTMHTYLALVLMVLGLSMAQMLSAEVKILEATGFYGSQTDYHNTWSPIESSSYNTCTTTMNGVTISGSKMQVNSTKFKIKGGTSFTISASSGYNIYRIVFKFNNSCVGTKTVPGQFKNYAGYADGSTWWSQDSNWDRTDPDAATNGRSSVTFTVNDADNDVVLDNINVYTYRTATSAQASISPSYTSGSPYVVDAFDDSSPIVFTLTTNLGITFEGDVNTYTNKVTTEANDDELEVSNVTKYDSYSNNSKITVNLAPYAKGTYACSISLGWQSSTNTASNYHMIAIGGLDFYVRVNDACTNTPTVSFNSPSPSCNPEALTCSSANFTRTANVTYLGNPTGQTITYSVVDGSDDILEVNPNTGAVTLTGDVGIAMIKASVASDGDYCNADAAYTVIVSGYSVTLHYPSCAAAVTSGTLTGTSKEFSDVCGAFNLNYDMSVEGYRFAGWTTSAVTTDPSSVTPLYNTSLEYTTSVHPANLYAVYSAVSNEFEKSTAATIVAGDYVITGSVNASTAPVMTNSLGSGKISANTTDYTVTSGGKLTCTEEQCIWTLAAVTGGWTIQNAANGKYLSAAAGAPVTSGSSSDLKLRLVDAPDDYSVWTITQGSSNRYNVVNNKRNTDGEDKKNFNCNGTYFGFYSNGISPFFFKRTASLGTYTSNASCNMAEYTVTIQQQTGGTVTATATGSARVWDDPVLSKLYGSETVTLTATPATGYEFSSWTVVSGGVTVSGTTTGTFTMPTSNVVIRPNFTAQTYQITYKDKNNAAFSGTPAEPSPDEYTYGVGATLPEVTKSGYVFMGWFVETDCSGTRVNSISTTDYGDKTFYAKFMQLSDYRAWCPEPTVTLTGDNVYITSTNGKSVKAVNTLTLNAINLVPGSTVRLSTPANSGVMFSSTGVKYNATTATIDFTADAGGDITDATVYVHYYPTTAGSGTPADVTVTAEYQTNTDYYSTKDVHVRNMPSAFAIAVKQGSNWFALPANMSGTATNPAGVPLNVDETTWTAKGPSTLAYELWPVKSLTGTGTDGYTDRGEKVRFTGNGNHGLWASTSTNTLNNNATISAVNADVTTNYEWNITTAVDGSTWKYTLKMEGQSNFLNYYNSSVWGSYGSGISDIYLIPLTAVETAGMAVMEWGESEVAVKCAASTTLTKVTIDGTEISPVSLTQICGDIYKITGAGMPNLSTLATYAMKSMVIEVSESSTDKQLVTTIPFILTSTNSPAAEPKTAVDLRNLAEGSSQDKRNTVIGAVDIVVRNGAQLDVKSEESTYCTFKDLYIYPGGKVHIDTKDLGAKNVYMRGGFSWLDPSKDYRLPQMLVESGMKIEGIGTAGHGVYYDLYLDNAMYYMMALPKDVLLNDITTETGSKTFDAWVKGYSGEGRTKSPKESGWSYAWANGGTTLYRGKGYEIAIKPTSGRTIGILRFPLLSATAWTDEATPDITVTAWGYDTEAGKWKDDVTPNNRGWNYIGNPFFTAFQNTDANGQFGTNMEIRNLQEHKPDGVHWDGKYEWVTDGTVKYITVPEKMYEDYKDVKAKDYTIEAFFPFFIQASATGKLSFTNGSRILKAPAFAAATVPAREVDVDFLITDPNGGTDNAGLTIGNDYSEDFDMDDKEKTIVNENFLKVYTMVGEYRTAFNSLPEAVAAMPIPVGYIAPVDGLYSISLEETEYPTVEHVWLTDYEENITIDLLDAQDNAYEFETVKGANDTRFALNVILKPEHEVPTDVGEVITEDENDKVVKFIYRDKMYIRYNGVIYDAVGKKVSEIK